MKFEVDAGEVGNPREVEVEDNGEVCAHGFVANEVEAGTSNVDFRVEVFPDREPAVEVGFISIANGNEVGEQDA